MNAVKSYLRLLLVVLSACTMVKCVSYKTIPIHKSHSKMIGGTEFFKGVISFNWRERDSLAIQLIRSGDAPSFLNKFVPIRTSIVDSVTGKRITGVYYVSRDYLSVGNNNDWARVPLTPVAAQQIADGLNCFLPTRKMVDAIYSEATVKLEPVPMYAFRDSSITMWQHHLIIEGQRKARKGLIAGIKKDVVISGKISRDPKADRVAIYGWHKLNGIAIQPLYTGHVNWYADYSHGIRLVYRTIRVNGKPMDYIDVLKSAKLRRLLCDEEYADFYRYGN